MSDNWFISIISFSAFIFIVLGYFADKPVFFLCAGMYTFVLPLAFYLRDWLVRKLVKKESE